MAESFAQGKTITTEISGRRTNVGGIFTLGSSLFKNGHVITSDWNYLRLFGKDGIDDIHVGVLTLEPGVNPQTVLTNIQASLPNDVKVMSRKEFVQSEKAFWSQEPAGIIFNFGTVMPNFSCNCHAETAVCGPCRCFLWKSCSNWRSRRDAQSC